MNIAGGVRTESADVCVNIGTLNEIINLCRGINNASTAPLAENNMLHNTVEY